MSGSILFVDQFSQLGGAQRCLLHLLPAFAQAGFVRHLAVPGDGPLVEGARRLGTFVHRIPSGSYSSGQKNWADTAQLACDLPRQAACIGSVVRRHNIDLIYVNGPRVLLAGALAADGLPLIFHAHSVVSQQSALRLVRWALRYAKTHVIAACEFVLDRLAPPHRGRSQVIYNGIPPVECAKRNRKEGSPWRIGIIGRIAPEKGHLEFVRAARSVLQQERCEFVVCGSAMFSTDEYSRRVHEETAGLPINFLGWRDDVGQVLSTLDLVIVPSAVVDATPLVILEAFSAGVPVVAFRSGGIPEIIEDGVTGILCSPDPDELSQTIVKLLQSARVRAFLDSLAARAKAAFCEQFCLERYRREILQAVRSAI